MNKTLNVLLLCVFFSNLYSQEIQIIDSSKDITEKEALVILNGFGDSKKNRKSQELFFKNKGYDLFIPEYVQRKSIGLTLSSFSSFYKRSNLDQYKEVKFLCYIIGGYVLNDYIEKHGKGKITTIIYDRSPIQERAPKTVVKKIPCVVKILYGNVIFDFSKEEIQPLNNAEELKIGVIIENKATKLMRIFKKTSNSFGEYNYRQIDIEINHDDFIHTILNHDQKYNR